MKADKLFQQFEEEWTYWKRALEGYTEEQLTELTEVSGWTIGQVYDHLIMTSYDLSREWIPECLDRTSNENGCRDCAFSLGQISAYTCKIRRTCTRRTTK